MRAKTETGIWVFEEGEVRRTSVRRLNGKGGRKPEPLRPPPVWRLSDLWDILQGGDIRASGDLLQMSTPVAVDSLATHQPDTKNPLAGYKFSWEMGTWKEKHWFPDQGGFRLSLSSLDGEGHLSSTPYRLSCSVHILTKNTLGWPKRFVWGSYGKIWTKFWPIQNMHDLNKGELCLVSEHTEDFKSGKHLE